MKVLGKILLGLIALCFAIPFLARLSEKQKAVVLPGYTGGDPNEKHELWSYTNETDQMSGKIIRQARVASSNGFDLGIFPYQGQQRAILLLRQHPRFGKDVILQVSKGQLICDFRDCKVTVRFDDGEPQQWPAAHPPDNSTTTLFLREYDHFIAKLNHAKVVRIEPTFYKAGSPDIEFPATGFDRARYEGNK